MALWQGLLLYALWILFCVQSARLLAIVWSGAWISRD